MTYEEIIKKNRKTQGNESIDIVCNDLVEPVFGDCLRYYNKKWLPQYYSLETYLVKNTYAKYCIFMLGIQDFFEEIVDNFYLLNEEQENSAFEKITKVLEEFIDYISINHSLIIMFMFEKIFKESIWDSLDIFIDKVNIYLFDLVREKHSIALLDVERILDNDKSIVKNTCIEGYYKYKFTGLRLLAQAANKYLEKWHTWNVKCIILDCDNVLWGGVAGEDVYLTLEKRGNGKVYRDFQREIIRLYKKGVIICLCSKNESENIWRVFEKNKNMLLNKEFISAYQINLRKKSINIRYIIEQLNLLPESILFIDDDKREIKEVLSCFKELKTIHFDVRNIVGVIKKMRGYFEMLPVQQFDSCRTKMYQMDSKRQEYLKINENHDINELLKTKIFIGSVTEKEISRIVELSQRTNQFNLSAKRYAESELKNKIQCEDYDLLYLRAEDEFGDMGIIAAMEIKYEKEKAIIEAFLVSCRVFGRGFEKQLLEYGRKRILQKNIRDIYGVYRYTNKNERFEAFYFENGLKVLRL